MATTHAHSPHDQGINYSEDIFSKVPEAYFRLRTAECDSSIVASATASTNRCSSWTRARGNGPSRAG